MLPLVGYNALQRDAMDRHLSSATNGPSYPGLVLDALCNGLLENFQGKILNDGAALTQVVAAASSNTIPNAAQYMQVDAAAANIAADAGIPDASATLSRGALRLGTDGVGAGAVALHQNDLLWINAGVNFTMCFEVTNTVGVSQVNTVALAQIGVMSAKGANLLVMNSLEGGVANRPGAQYLFVEISGSRARLVCGDATSAVYSGWTQLGSRQVSFRIDYVATAQTANFSVDGKFVSSVSASKLTQALQVFARAGHVGVGTALSVDVDTLMVSIPRA
jgi:hypothetical protein